MTGIVGEVIRWWAAEQPEARAIVFAGEPVSFAEVHCWTDRVAADLRRRGIEPGDRVGIFASNALEWCIAAFGIIKAGAILVPLNYRYQAAEVASVAQDCQPKIVFTDEARGGRLTDVDATVLPLSDIAKLRHGEDVAIDYVHDPDATIVIAYTSGSTAKPKGVMFTHRTTIAYAHESMLNWPVYRVGAKSLNIPPLYTGGGTVQLLHFMNLGMTAFIEPEFNVERTLDLLIEEKMEILCGVPTFLEWIAQSPRFADAELSHIQLSAVGGARVPIELQKAWLEKGVVVRQLYGLTEGGGNTSIMSKEGALDHPEQCGRGGIFTQHRVVDPDGKDCPPGEPGEIWVRGPAVMKGYWNAPEATAAAFTNGWLRTGDVAVADEQGNMQIIDRLKDMIISGGLNIWPLDIEAVIGAMPGVDEVAVIGTRDERFGETVMAVIRSTSGLQIPQVIEHCNAHLADYKVPRYVVVQEEPLPRLATGKLSKRELKARYADAETMLVKVR
ncbi:AMP-binding protein [Sphingomonas sp. CGMCC 1.13654]|uniref:AMP-binding protein n=1 Tax=Sphingomonas chungangi TaxID=2683589 RepID=A0A838L5R0_9SPHN|nr:AMP-binding protein [Sphingomonas chungangi]MBA2933799.1 AMP-binding protein [Sphingomonas chungangi]MVW55129.1 AMP-binding protein [Sphingomonas chungangi]